VKPWRKPQPPADTRPKLEVVAGGNTELNQKEGEPSYGLIFGFLGIAAAVLATLIYLSPGNRWRLDGLETSFLNLKETYQKHGMQRFLEQKELLKQSLGSVIRESSDPSQINLATNIAVYLFPDILPDENFEKETAGELWSDAFGEIEKNPHTPEARVIFEDLRANIWNYELADRVDPKLSAPAREVIQLYDTLSAP
jgi:hypothetical protein